MVFIAFLFSTKKTSIFFLLLDEMSHQTYDGPLQWMTEAAFSHLDEAEGQTLKNIRLLVEYRSWMLIFFKKIVIHLS